MTIDDYEMPTESYETLTDKFDFTIWMGDFNYRIDLPRDIIQDYLINKKLDSLLNKDQFFQQIIEGNIDFNQFFESRINFYPTYKFVEGTDHYNFDNKRLPGWTDRIIYKVNNKFLEKNFSVMRYNWIRIMKFSDHKPVCSEFICNISKSRDEQSNFDNKINIKQHDDKVKNTSKTCNIF